MKKIVFLLINFFLMRIFKMVVVVFIFAVINSKAQPPTGIHWNSTGTGYFQTEGSSIVEISLPSNDKRIIATKAELTPKDSSGPLYVRNFFFSPDNKKLMIYTNTKRVWRLDTRGDYWLLDLQTKELYQLGKSRPASSLMFAKFSPDGNKVAYVSNYNIYVEDLATHSIKALTTNGNRKLINGTFDWVYEEEFSCRDGFRWSADSKNIAYWQLDAKSTKDYLMINNTDSLYPFVIPVEYPVAGEPPSPYKIGVVNISDAKTKWMEIPTDPVLQSYVPRMEWANNANELIIQHLNRLQNTSTIMLCDAKTGKSRTIYKEQDSAWIDIISSWDSDYDYGGWNWLSGGKEFLWASEKDGWRHLYRISRDGKSEIKITTGDYDVVDISSIDEAGNYVYFLASPNNATQRYLYRTKLDGTGKAERLSPETQNGTHGYEISPSAKFAVHSFTNYYTPGAKEWITLPDHQSIGESAVEKAIRQAQKPDSSFEFFKVKSANGIDMDGWIAKPTNFDPSKKYPVLFYVYTEPAGQNVRDVYGVQFNRLYPQMLKDGYVYISIDNRGTPVPKGRAWRKSVYRKIGLVNIADQAAGAREAFEKFPFIDTSRVAVWGWSGGGSATLNLMFQYPEIYKTGISIAAVGSQFTYDNIYQERFMGLPQQNRTDFINGSPITYAKNLKGNLLYIHGTGDDNVHYNNAELLVNELIKYNKIFQFMPYPNRSHGIYEGEGTSRHLTHLFTEYLKTHCPPGGR